MNSTPFELDQLIMKVAEGLYEEDSRIKFIETYDTTIIVSKEDISEKLPAAKLVQSEKLELDQNFIFYVYFVDSDLENTMIHLQTSNSDFSNQSAPKSCPKIPKATRSSTTIQQNWLFQFINNTKLPSNGNGTVLPPTVLSKRQILKSRLGYLIFIHQNCPLNVSSLLY